MTDGLAVVERIGKLGDPATEQPTQPVVIESVTRRGAVSVAAIVLAAGEASRFGTPKQRLLLPEVLERLEQSPVDEIVVVAGAHTLETAGAGRHLRRLEARAGRVARAAGSPRSAPTLEAAIVVLADGPDLAPEAVDRVIDVWRDTTAATSSRRPTAASVAIRCCLRAQPGRHSRTRACATVEARLVPCDDLGAPGDVDTPADLPERLAVQARPCSGPERAASAFAPTRAA